jgi:hypothetical protein
MKRVFFFAFIFCGFLSFAPGQPNRERPPAEAEGVKSESFAPFPLGPLLVMSRQKTIVWRPDWDSAIPPDGFRVSPGTADSIDLSVRDRTYRVRWNTDGSPAEFPFWGQGQFVQVEATYGPSGDIQGLVITGSAETGRVDFIKDNIARITQGDAVCFAAVRWGPLEIAETWYDSEGTALADFRSRICNAGGEPRLLGVASRYEEKEETYYYDSFGNISEIRSSEGVFSALYTGEQQPRYWTRGAEHHTLQWDARGLAVRVSSGETPETRYEYTVDLHGNWTERREIRMISQQGMLVPNPGATVKRTIAYKKGG